jgi:hypothetical protein
MPSVHCRSVCTLLALCLSFRLAADGRQLTCLCFHNPPRHVACELRVLGTGQWALVLIFLPACDWLDAAHGAHDVADCGRRGRTGRQGARLG